MLPIATREIKGLSEWEAKLHVDTDIMSNYCQCTPCLSDILVGNIFVNSIIEKFDLTCVLSSSNQYYSFMPTWRLAN